MPPRQRDGQEIRGFLGVNLRKDRLNLLDEEVAKAIDADFHTEIGSAIARLGRRTQFASALADLVVRRLARIGTRRYQIAGRSIYRDQANIGNGILSANLFTTIAAFRPLTDTTTWAFIADDAVMRKDNGTTLRTWGLAVPANAPTLQIGIGTGLTGAYTAVTTEIRYDGTTLAHESNPSATPTAVTLADQTLAIGDIRHPTDTQVNGIGLYRTQAGGSTHLLVTRVALPTSGTAYSVTFPWEVSAVTGFQLQWSVDIGSSQRGTQAWEPTLATDSEDTNGRRGTYLWEQNVQAAVTTQTNRWAYHSSEIDSALVTEAVLDNDTPPAASWCVEYANHMMLCREAANPHYLRFSKRFQSESFPTGNYIEIGTPDDPIQCAIPVAGLLGVFTRRTKYRVVGNAASGFVPSEALSHRGTPAPAAALATERGIVFVARDGVFLTNLIQADEELSAPIARLFYGEDVNGINHINWDAASTMAAASWKGRYYLAIPTGTATAPDLMAVYSTVSQHWYFYQHAARSLLVEEDTDTLTAGFGDGLVYLLESGSSDSIALDLETKDYSGPSVSTSKLFLWVKPDIDCAGATVSVDLYVDGTLKRTTTITGTRTRPLLAFPEGSLGASWRVGIRYTGTARPRVYGVAATWLPLEFA